MASVAGAAAAGETAVAAAAAASAASSSGASGLIAAYASSDAFASRGRAKKSVHTVQYHTFI